MYVYIYIYVMYIYMYIHIMEYISIFGCLSYHGDHNRQAEPPILPGNSPNWLAGYSDTALHPTWLVS